MSLSLVEQLNKLLEKVAFLPLSFWVSDFNSLKESLISGLEQILKSVDVSTDVGQKIDSLLKVIKNNEIQELALAKNIQGLTAIFDISGNAEEEVKYFKQLSMIFLKRAQLFDHYQKQRDEIKSVKNQDEQKVQDLILIQKIGIGYVLEYYLSIYKMLQEFNSPEEKTAFINQKEINLGFGGLPGLLRDIEQDESLSKFLLLILNDTMRENLIKPYFLLKTEIMRNPLDIVNTEKALKGWVVVLLEEFDKAGIVSLTSVFFKPYGEKPSIKDLLNIFG